MLVTREVADTQTLIGTPDKWWAHRAATIDKYDFILLKCAEFCSTKSSIDSRILAAPVLPLSTSFGCKMLLSGDGRYNFQL